MLTFSNRQSHLLARMGTLIFPHVQLGIEDMLAIRTCCTQRRRTKLCVSADLRTGRNGLKVPRRSVGAKDNDDA